MKRLQRFVCVAAAVQGLGAIWGGGALACGAAPKLQDSLDRADEVHFGSLAFDATTGSAVLRTASGRAIAVRTPPPISEYVGRSGLWFVDAHEGALVVFDLLDAPEDQSNHWLDALADGRLDDAELRVSAARAAAESSTRLRVLDAMEANVTDAELEDWLSPNDPPLRRWAVHVAIARACQSERCLGAYAEMLESSSLADVLAAGPSLPLLPTADRHRLSATLLEHPEAAARASATHYAGTVCDAPIGEMLVASIHRANDPFALYELGEAVRACPAATLALAREEWALHPLGAAAWRGTGLEAW